MKSNKIEVVFVGNQGRGKVRGNKVRFLVTRVDALHDYTKTIHTPKTAVIATSEVWPCVIEAETHEDALERVYATKFVGSGLPKNRPFLVVALIDPVIVELKPKPSYDIVSRPV